MSYKFETVADVRYVANFLIEKIKLAQSEAEQPYPRHIYDKYHEELKRDAVTYPIKHIDVSEGRHEREVIVYFEVPDDVKNKYELDLKNFHDQQDAIRKHYNNQLNEIRIWRDEVLSIIGSRRRQGESIPELPDFCEAYLEKRNA